VWRQLIPVVDQIMAPLIRVPSLEICSAILSGRWMAPHRMLQLSFPYLAHLPKCWRKLVEVPEQLFTNMTLSALQSLLQSLDQMRICEVWAYTVKRAPREGEIWINAIAAGKSHRSER
jgi:hypothetical protein